MEGLEAESNNSRGAAPNQANETIRLFLGKLSPLAYLVVANITILACMFYCDRAPPTHNLT